MNVFPILLKRKMHSKKRLSNEAKISFLAMNGAIQSCVLVEFEFGDSQP